MMTCMEEVLRIRIIPNRTSFVIWECLGNLDNSRSININNNTIII